MQIGRERVQDRRSARKVAGHVIAAQGAQVIAIVHADVDRDRTDLSAMGAEKCECSRQLRAIVGIVQRETSGRVEAPAVDECRAGFAGASVIQRRDTRTDLPKHARTIIDVAGGKRRSRHGWEVRVELDKLKTKGHRIA